MKKPKGLRMVMLTESIANDITVLRYGKDNDGFQRKRDLQKVAEIVQAVKDGVVIPPIVVYNIDGKLAVGDGQHRLEAWRGDYKFPLYALFVDRTTKEAARDFCVLNGTARRVGLRLRLSVDTAPYALAARAMAERHQADVRQVHNLLDGIRPGVRGKYPAATASDWRMANGVLAEWKNDVKWNSKSSIYSKPGVLKMVGYFVRKSPWSQEQTIRALKRLNYSKDSSLANHYGAAASSQNRMRLMAYRELGLGLGTAPSIRQRQEA